MFLANVSESRSLTGDTSNGAAHICAGSYFAVFSFFFHPVHFFGTLLDERISHPVEGPATPSQASAEMLDSPFSSASETFLTTAAAEAADLDRREFVLVLSTSERNE